MEEENKKDNNEVNEPFVQYNATGNNSRRIQFFNSHEEMEIDQLKYFASLTPMELLSNLNILVKMSFGIKEEEPIKLMSGKINLNPER